MMKSSIAAMILVILAATQGSGANVRPNILIVMADDLGYSDLGCYGGEIQTPNLDAVAAGGIQFTHFRASPMCVTSRIALLSGMPMQRAGGAAYKHSVPLPIAMKRAGYRTMMTGKWHAGTPDPRSKRLFDRSFGFLGGMTDSFVGSDDWFAGNQAFNDFGDDFYSTDAFADSSIEFMREAARMDQPFFMYVAMNAPHHPCQAPEQTVRKYAGVYEAGYDSIRRARHQRQVELGLVDPKWPIGPLGGEVRRWDQLNRDRQGVEAGRMAAYAAAVEHVDAAMGRMIEFLDQAGLGDNTLVIFLSDNGGDYSNGGIDKDAGQVAWMPHNNPTSSNGWAAVKATPFRFYKHACHEGGLAVPMIIRWPGGIKRPPGARVAHPVNITDLYPTLLDVAGAEYPESFQGHRARPLAGTSLAGLLASDRAPESKPVFQHYRYSRAWIDGRWKAVKLYEGPWQLFDMETDRGETQDLANAFPERLENMARQWTTVARQDGIAEADIAGTRTQPGWGWHRMQMVLPGLESTFPANGSTISSGERIDVTIKLGGSADFARTTGRTIRLYRRSGEQDPVWQSDPEADHPSQGRSTITLGRLPELDPDTQYYFIADPGWVRVGGKPAGPINDGAYWWRFQTMPSPEIPSKPRE